LPGMRPAESALNRNGMVIDVAGPEQNPSHE
jgi:hypothetical protein